MLREDQRTFVTTPVTTVTMAAVDVNRYSALIDSNLFYSSLSIRK